MKTNFDDPETYELLIDVCARYQIDPSSSIEAEDFFSGILSAYQGDSNKEALVAWLEKQLSKEFISLNETPHWIQGYEWQFANGKPMIFVGQLDLRIPRGSIASQYFHDDTSFYIFIAPGESPRIIMQQF
jgi:hypothetical protein